MKKILVVIPVEDRHKKLLEAASPDSEFVYIPVGQCDVETIHSADIIIGNVPPKKLAGTEKLRWIQLNSAGTDGFTAPGVLPEGALLTNATGAYGLAISEHMLAMLLTLMKKLNVYGRDQQEHRWSDHGNVTSIWNSRTLVVGLGDIGSEFASRMAALGSEVTGIRRTKAEKPEYLKALYQLDQLKEVIGEADIVALTLPGTKETYRLFNADMLGRMKKGAILLNVGRGTAVDSDALADALNSGHLFGAGIDVTDPEPLPADHPLWEAENILITPHISGQYHLPETFERIVRIAAENLRRLEAGEGLKNIVDFETGYRKLG